MTSAFGSSRVLWRLIEWVLSLRSPSKPPGRKLIGVTDWESVSRNSLSEERLETRSLPTRSPPGTPNQWVHLCFIETPNLMSKDPVGCLGDGKKDTCKLYVGEFHDYMSVMFHSKMLRERIRNFILQKEIEVKSLFFFWHFHIFTTIKQFFPTF